MLEREAIKVAGGAEYEALLARERDQRARFRAAHPEMVRAERKNRERISPQYRKSRLVARARQRGRKAGLEATITAADLDWPTHCPVLGIELEYPVGKDSERVCMPNYPSLDRWDNSKGYVPGNVFVISQRANALKSDATAEELMLVARYAAQCPKT